MARRDDPAEALARAYRAVQGLPVLSRREEMLRGLAADGWRLTCEPELTVERLARALGPLLPQHKEGLASLPPSPSDRSWVVYDGWQPAALAAAILAALEEER